MGDMAAQVNEMTRNLNKAMECGPACQVRREAKTKLAAFQAAEQWETKGPETLYETRKDYLTFVDGEQGYDARMMEKYVMEARAHAGVELDTHARRMEDMDRGIRELVVGKQTLEGLKRLQKILTVEGTELSKAKKDALGNVETNNARVALSVNADRTLQMVRTIVTVLCAGALAAYLWRGPFIAGRQYNTIKGWVFACSLIAAVYYSSAITTWVMQLWTVFWWLLKDDTPHDVYTDLDA